MTTNNAINNTLATPFTIGATSVTSTGTQLNLLNGLTVVPINKINVQAITSTGAYTYSPTAGTLFAIFQLQAGGGGSGGTTCTAGQAAAGGSGGGGGYMEVLVSGATNLAAVSGSVGIAGTAGASGNNNGGNGGNTTMTVNAGTTWTASGGGLGGGEATSAAAQAGGTAGAGGGVSNGTNGTLLFSMAGQVGATGFTAAVGGAVPIMIGAGGDSFLGRGGQAIATAGSSGSGYGAGAGGGINNTGSNSAGTAGQQGVVLVTEFISA